MSWTTADIPDLTGKVAIVTGANSGLGFYTTLELARHGALVVMACRSREKTDEAIRDIRGSNPESKLEFMALDLSDVASVGAFAKAFLDMHKRLDVLVNNAGIGSIGAAEETSVAQAQGVFDINVFGVMRMVKEVLPFMRAQGRGRIINVSSVQGFIPAPYMAVYGASKHAVEGYTESLDHEVRDHGVRALLVEPAYTKTGFEANSAKPDTPLQAYADQRQVFDRLMAEAIKDGDDPAVVAEAIVAAATDAKPKLRYTAGPMAGRARILRLVPAWAFDRQIRKMNKLAG